MRSILLSFTVALIMLPHILCADMIDQKFDMFIVMEEIPEPGGDLAFDVVVFNPNDQELVLTFGSPLQVDYTIDDYRFSSLYDVPDEETSVTIPANNQYTWHIIHTSEQYEILPGYHVLTATLMDHRFSASIEFSVPEKEEPLPEGITLSLVMSKESYACNEPLTFTLSAANNTGSDITLPVTAGMPVKYRIEYDARGSLDDSVCLAQDTIIYSFEPDKTDVVLPAGGSKSWEEVIDLDEVFSPGEYILTAGLSGYEDEVSTGYTINDTEITGTLSGTVTTYSDDGNTMIPVGGATVEVWSEARHRPLPYITEDSDPDAYVQHWNIVTDSNGYFLLEEVPVNWFMTVNIRKDGYTSYSESFMISKEKYVLKPVLKRIHEEAPLNYHNYKISDLEISIGTSTSIYDPQSMFRGHLTVMNIGVEPVSFEFEDNNYVTWTFAAENGDTYEIRDRTVYVETGEDEGYESAFDDSNGLTMVIEPGSSRTFTLTDSLDALVSVSNNSYRFKGSLSFVSSSNEELNPGDVSSSLQFKILESTSTRIETVPSDDDEFVVDLRDNLDTTLDVYMRDYAAGEMQVTEMRENLYESIQNHRFIKMVNIDADTGIKANMEYARIRIYFEPGDYQNPENLVIAHWNDSEESSDEVLIRKTAAVGWEILETEVNLDEYYAEAYTTSFSSFGLFESDEPTSVDDGSKPAEFALLQNQPNPFNPTTTLSFTLPDACDTQLIVYNISGQEVARLINGRMEAGSHQIVFDAANLASGVYFYRITGNGFMATKRMMLVR